MDADKIQDNIDTLLIFMNDDMENLGGTIDTVVFNFEVDQDDRIAFDKLNNWPESDFLKIVNICNSRLLLKKQHGKLARIALTEEGQSRAISVKHGKKRSYELGASMQIATLNVHGPAQVGNGNVQNINNAFNQLLLKIDESDATEPEKMEAKSLLTKLIENPLVCSIVGGLAGGLPGLI